MTLFAMRPGRPRKIDSSWPGTADTETLDLAQLREKLLAREPPKDPAESWPSADIRNVLRSVAGAALRTRVDLVPRASAMTATLTRTAPLAAAGATSAITGAARSTIALMLRMFVAAREFAGRFDIAAAASAAIAAIVWAARAVSTLVLALFVAARRFVERLAVPAPPAATSTTPAIQEAPIDDASVVHDREIKLSRLRLAARESAHGFNDPDVASELHLLGALEHEAGRFNEALALYSTALTIRQRTLGRDHPEVAATLGDLEAARRDEADSETEADVAPR